MLIRFENNPILTKHSLKPSFDNWIIECVLNPGVFKFEGKTWMLLRVAERPFQQNGQVSFPIFDHQGDIEVKVFDDQDPDLDVSDPRMIIYKKETFLSTISHLRLVCSDDGQNFYEPEDRPASLFGQGSYYTLSLHDALPIYRKSVV